MVGRQPLKQKQSQCGADTMMPDFNTLRSGQQGGDGMI